MQEHGTSFRKEAMAGAVSFFTVVYIVAVNAAILADAGIPFEAGVIATVLTAVAGCLLVGFWANSPIVLVPGMGINALFSYTLVHGMGLTWQEALAAVLISGIMVTVVSFTPLSRLIAASIPESLKHAITAGIGLFLTFIGLQKGGIVVPSESTLVAFGNFAHAKPLLTMATFAVTLVLFVRNVRGNLLIGIAAGTLLAALFGETKLSETGGFGFSVADYASVFGAMSFAKATTAVFWIAVFSLVLVILFESVGLIHGQLQMANRPEKFKRSLQASAMSVITSGLFGSSPTVSAVESAAGIASGGRTGLTAVTTGVLFAGSLLFIPVIKLIPDSAIAPVLILIGGLMIQNVRDIPFDDITEWFPAYLIIAFIPLTSSIVDGMAFGFLAYPLLKIAAGKWREIGAAAYVIAVLFLINFVLHAL